MSLMQNEKVLYECKAYSGISRGALILTNIRILFEATSGFFNVAKSEAYLLSKISSVEISSEVPGSYLKNITIQSSGGFSKFQNINSQGAALFVDKTRQALYDIENKQNAKETMSNPIDAIRQLGVLKDSGILTEQEFNIKKAELLSKI